MGTCASCGRSSCPRVKHDGTCYPSIKDFSISSRKLLATMLLLVQRHFMHAIQLVSGRAWPHAHPPAYEVASLDALVALLEEAR